MNNETSDAIRYPFEFTGSGWQYFKIWIVNILLSIVTLYIYSAWAKVRTKRYFYGNTQLDNSTFEYHAKGSQIVLGRIIALMLLIGVTLSSVSPVVSGIATLLLFLLLPWAIWRSLKFNARMSSFRNVRFGYRGKLLPLYAITLLLPLVPLLISALIAGAMYFIGMTEGLPAVAVLAVLATYLFLPMVQKVAANHVINRYRYGTSDYSTSLSAGTYYAAYFFAFLLWVLFLILVIVIVGVIAVLSGVVSPDMFDQFAESLAEGEADAVSLAFSPMMAVMGVLAYAGILMISFLASAYLRAKIRNHTYEQTLIDKKVSLQSTLKTWPLFRVLFSNFILIVITLGLGYPWAKVRMVRYMARSSAIYSRGTLDGFVNAEKEKLSALGEELGDAFDMDMDMGF